LELKAIKRFLKKFFSERAKIGGVQGEENFCPRANSKIAKQFFVSRRLDFSQNEFGFRPINTTKALILKSFGLCLKAFCFNLYRGKRVFKI